jgi:hypothetical protein
MSQIFDLPIRGSVPRLFPARCHRVAAQFSRQSRFGFPWNPWLLSTFLLFHFTSEPARGLTNLNIRLISNVRPSANPISYGDVWAENDLACLGVWLNYNTYNYGVGIYSISNPAAPFLLSVYSPSPTSQNQFELGAVRNRIGYFGSWSGGGLHIVSLTNPAAPLLICRVGATSGNVTNGFDRVHTIFLERNFLYEAAHVPGIVSVKVFDVSNPSLPVYLRDIVTTNTTKVHQITVRNKGNSTLLYTSGWGGNDNSDPNSPGQTDIWDVTNVGNQPAQWLGRIYSGYNSHSSWPTPDGNTLIVCREIPGGDVRFYDISNPASIPSNAAPLVTLTPASMGLEGDIPHNPVVVSNFLFLSWYQNGIQIFDITDRTKPVRLGFYDTYPAAQSSSYQGNWGVFPNLGFDKLLLSDIQSGLFVMDASAVLTPTNNYPPMIVAQPTSLTVTQGINATFAPVVTGSLLRYQWLFNGTPIAGATAGSLTLTNVQTAQAGNYSVIVSNASASITSSPASLSVLSPQETQTVFFENFDDASASTNWNLFDGSANGISDYTVNWSFDYSTYFSAFNNAPIPSAPNSTNGTTRGVRLTVNNNDATGATAGVSLYPKNKNFSGAYKCKFDLWINYPGTAGGAGSVGSTEHATFGLNHAGTRVNWGSTTATSSDGVWFATDGEGGTTLDYRAYVGTLTNNPALLSFAASGLAASGATSQDSADSYFQSIFPSPTYESPGAPGKRWVQVEVSQDANNIVTWRMNGNLIAQRPNTSPFTNGTIMLGYMDLFSSIASPAADAFVLFDNVRVEVIVPLTPPLIATQPQSLSVFPDEDATFSLAASGSAPLSYQWQFNGAIIPGATNSSYIRLRVQAEDVGAYSVIVANAAGSVLSSNAFLLLRDSPYLNAVAATPGERSALISWNTTVPSDSLVQFDVATGVVQNPSSESAAAQSSFSSSSYLDTALTTNHVILLTGLMPGTRYSFQVISAADTNTYISGVYQFMTAGTIILDNPAATFTGAWTVTNNAPDEFSTNYAWANAGGAAASATFRPNIITPGKYDVDVWYTQGPDRANNAPFTISYNGGSTTVPVNQQNGGGSWQLLAAGLDFAKGTNGYIRLSNNANPGIVVADAVRLTYVESQDFPTGQTIPTWWQNFYFGGPVDPTLDPDADGYTTAQEYLMGTVPTNASSHLQFSGESVSNTAAQVRFWPLLGNRGYQLLYRPEIGQPDWRVTLPGLITATPDGHGIFAITTSNAARNFYRLKVQMTTNSSFSGGLPVPPGRTYSPFASDPLCGPNRAYIR